MPQVVREYLPRLHPGALAKFFHVPPDVGSVQGPPIPADKHRSGGDFLLLEVVLQELAQLVRQEHGAALALVADLGPATLYCLRRNEAQLTHANAGGTNGLNDQGKALVFCTLGGLYQTDVLGLGQLLVLGEKEGLLYF